MNIKKWDSYGWWIYLLRNSTRNVWLTTGRDDSSRTPPGTPFKSRISPKQNHPRTMDAQNKKNMLHFSCSQLCNQIHKIGRSTKSKWSSQKWLQHNSRLDATKYIGLTIKWDYVNCKVHVHMPGYLSKALLQFNHPQPKKNQNSPFPYVAPQYGAKIQCTPDVDDSPPLNKEETK